MKRIYLDHAATTPADSEVLKAMKPYFSQKFGNPMSIHSFGQEAREAIERARLEVANFLNCEDREVVFTSGATESNNLAIKGVIKSYNANIRSNSPEFRSYSRVSKPHIITTQFEHHCVINTCRDLEKEGEAEVAYLPVYKDGIVKLADVKKAIKPNTVLVSVMYVNNEIGTVQPIKIIGKLIKQIRNKNNPNYKLQITNYPLFHIDATQAVNYFNCDVKRLGVDLLSFSGHKIYGPKGIGALYIRKGTPIKRIQDGGEQEFKLRAGTHNVPGIVGLGEAIRQVQSSKLKVKSVLKLRNYLIKGVLKEIPKSYLNGSVKFRSLNNANFRFDNVEGESVVLALDAAGVAASTGSACSSSTLEPSHVLMALGLKHEQAHGSLRLTLGKNTTKKDIDLTIDKLKDIIKNLRKISGNILEKFEK